MTLKSKNKQLLKFGLITLCTLMISSPITLEAKARTRVSADVSTVSAKSQAKTAAKPVKFHSTQEFVSTLLPYAKKVGKKHNIDPKIMLAQAAHETSWGKSIPRHKNGESSHNLFGIKASAQSSQKIKVKTIEHRKGSKRTEYASFRSYSNYEESFEHYAQLMKRDRFKAVLKMGDNPRAYFSHLQKAGYATDPKYAQKLIGVYNHPAIKKIG